MITGSSPEEISPADPCECPTKNRYRPPAILLKTLRRVQKNRCHYQFKNCTKTVDCVAHLCHNPPCRNENHLVGSCDSCNVSISNVARSQPSRRYAGEYVNVQKSVEEEDTMEKNRRTEPAWVDWIFDKLRKLGPGVGLPKKDLTGESALAVDISVATVDRHWKKYAASTGPFMTYRPEKGTRILARLREIKK